jgi:hypothetical protein
MHPETKRAQVMDDAPTSSTSSVARMNSTGRALSCDGQTDAVFPKPVAKAKPAKPAAYHSMPYARKLW